MPSVTRRGALAGIGSAVIVGLGLSFAYQHWLTLLIAFLVIPCGWVVMRLRPRKRQQIKKPGRK